MAWLIQEIIDFFVYIFDLVIDFFVDTYDEIVKFLRYLVNNIIDYFESVYLHITDYFSEWGKIFSSYFYDLFNDIVQFGYDLGSDLGFAEELTSMQSTMDSMSSLLATASYLLPIKICVLIMAGEIATLSFLRGSRTILKFIPFIG